MIDKEMLEEYVKLNAYVKSNLYYFLAIRSCFNYGVFIPDETIITISNLAYDCWREDNNNIDIDEYANYILDGIYKYGGTLEQILDKDPEDIVELYTDGKSSEELSKYIITSECQYCFTTDDKHKYYTVNDEDGFLVLDENGRKIREPHPMENIEDTIFRLFENKKIIDCPMTMHYNIRSMIKDSQNDEEYMDNYKKGINAYKKYCEERFVTSKDILKIVKSDENIDISNFDNKYTEENKLNRLKKILKSNGKSYNDNYIYVASLSNGNDYFIDNENNNKYLAIDKNNILKEFDTRPFFLLNEIHSKEKFSYISDSELKKIRRDFVREYENNNFEIFKQSNNYYKISSLDKFMTYLKNKEINLFKRDVPIDMMIDARLLIYNSWKESIEVGKQMKQKLNEKVMRGTYVGKPKNKENKERDL